MRLVETMTRSTGGDDPRTLSRPAAPTVPGIVNETAGTVARKSAAGVTVTTQPFPLSPSRSCESTRSKCAPRTVACPRCVLAGPFPLNLNDRLSCGYRRANLAHRAVRGRESA